MGILDKLTGLISGGAVKAASGVADIVERWKPSEAAKHEMKAADDKVDADTAASARAYVAAPSHESWLDYAVDGFNRLIRPGITVIFVGAVCGWWGLPPPGTIDPWYLMNAERALIFWFGGRALFRDLPDALAYYKSQTTRK